MVRINIYINGIDYSEEKIQQLYEDCIRYNDFYTERYAKYHHKEDKKKLLDMRAFDGFIK